MSDLAATFRARTATMKTWKPRNTPSSRDRLELYALHKQAASGDAPATSTSSSSATDITKYNAWKGKRGMSQDEAMKYYIMECDRQMRTYGTASENTAQTPVNTPSAQQTTQHNNNHSISTSKGLAAIPLLCAAATETRQAYISRLRSTSHGDGWWLKQEALCAEPSSLLATPEKALIHLAQMVESFSLYVQSPSNLLEEYIPFLSPSVVQALLWPIHNVLLALWIWMIVCCTTVGSLASTVKTILFGSNTTGLPLDDIYKSEVAATHQICRTLCDAHQALSVRLVGLALWPWDVTSLQTTAWVLDCAGYLPALTFFSVLTVCSWWYWIFVLPWLAAWAIGLASLLGVGYGLIELAGM